MGIQERKAREFCRREREILRAALALFRGDDWETVTVEQIAQQAEIGKGTVYKHFASKDEIYARLALDFHRAVLKRVRRIDPSLPAGAQLSTLVAAGWEAHLTSRELHRVVVYCGRPGFLAALSPTTAAGFEAIEAERGAMLRRILGQGIASGEFAPLPVDSLLFSVYAAFWGAVQILWSDWQNDSPDRETCLAELTRFLLAGLSGGAAASPRAGLAEVRLDRFETCRGTEPVGDPALLSACERES
jgi:AcrR family transcriptional regulator